MTTSEIEPEPPLSVEQFEILATARGVKIRMKSFDAIRVESAQAIGLAELANELGLFILGVEGFERLDADAIRPNLAWIFDGSKLFEASEAAESRSDAAVARRESAKDVLAFPQVVPVSPQIFLEFLLVP